MNAKQKLHQVPLQEWTVRFADQKASVLTVRQWCEQNHLSLIVKVVVSKNIYFLFVQVIRYCSVPDVSINKLSTFIGNHVRHRILPDHHHFE